MNTQLPEGLLDNLRNLIRIPSVSVEAEDEYPFGKAVYDALEYVLDLCASCGFRTRFVGKHMGYAEIGEGEEMVGILTHLDVVPAGSGWDTDPFDLTLSEGVLYGRGVIDDKGPAMLMIYAAKAMLDSGHPLNKRYRLIFGCSEETGVWEDIEKYKREEELPSYGFAADSDFPVVFAEKGILQLWLSMDKKGSGVIEARGGSARNIIPDHCEILAEGNAEYVREQGRAAHGSTPWDGENAISKAMCRCRGRFADMYNTCISNDWTGAGLGIDSRDELSGETTVNAGIIETTENKVRLSLDIRYCVTCSQEQILESLTRKLSPYNIDISVIDADPPSVVDPKTPFVGRLMDAYRKITGDNSEAVVQGGGTYAKAMPSTVAFGPNFPGAECTEHQANERISLDDFERAYQVYVEALKVL